MNYYSLVNIEFFIDNASGLATSAMFDTGSYSKWANVTIDITRAFVRLQFSLVLTALRAFTKLLCVEPG